MDIRYLIYDILLVRGKVFVPMKDGPHNVWCYGTTADEDEALDHHETYTDARGEVMPFQSERFNRQRYPRYADYEKYKYGTRRHEMSLLQGVCKTIQGEAEAFFYGGKNQFVLPVGPWPFRRIFPFQNISVSFDMRDHPVHPWMTRGILQERRPTVGRSFKQMTQRERQKAMHDQQLYWLSEMWYARARRISNMRKLAFLQLDFEECYCPMGCCRCVEEIFERIWCNWQEDEMEDYYDSDGEELEKRAIFERIEITGLIDHAEARYVQSTLARYFVPSVVTQTFYLVDGTRVERW